MMTPRQFVMLAALCGTFALAAWCIDKFGFGSFTIGDTSTPIGDRDPTPGAISLSAEGGSFDASPATVARSPGDAATSAPDSTEPKVTEVAAAEEPSVEAPSLDSRISDPTPGAISSSAEAGSFDASPATVTHAQGDATTSAPDSTEPKVAEVAAAETPVVEAASLDSRPTPPPEKLVRLVSAFPSRAVGDHAMPAVQPVKPPNECLVADICIDEYLWSLYERTPKLDTNKETERIKKTVKKKGKIRTVIATITKYVLGDFTWKDPIAAEKVGMSVKDYVIGGMDRGFKQKLYLALRAMDEAGLMPGITSAFRDDYRQAIATGNKAASDSSYHGGSRRGGYGHGLAADLVSVKGETRMERYAASDELWKWIDAHEKELGIGRPYRDRDPPHVGAIDGREYIVKRALANVKKPEKAKSAQTAKLQTKKHPRTARDNPGATKRATPEKPSKVSSLQTRAALQR